MSNLKLFEGSEIRARWDDDEEQWYFVVQDVIGFLTDSTEPSKYWSALKRRTIENEGVELSTNCRQLKFKARDNKTYKYESAGTETLLRIIQSIPSPNAEPFKRWLAQLGKERLDEIEKPELAMERARNYYKTKGRTDEWISDRTSGIQSRNNLTDHWKSTGVQGSEYAILTNEIYNSTFGMTAINYKNYKGIDKKDSLRDNMNPLELVLTRFAEVTAKEIGEAKGYKELDGNKKAIQEGGKIVKDAVERIEENTGRKIASKGNFKHLDTDEKHREISSGEVKPVKKISAKIGKILAAPSVVKSKKSKK